MHFHVFSHIFLILTPSCCIVFNFNRIFLYCIEFYYILRTWKCHKIQQNICKMLKQCKILHLSVPHWTNRTPVWPTGKMHASTAVVLETGQSRWILATQAYFRCRVTNTQISMYFHVFSDILFDFNTIVLYFMRF